jgi:hypothetical protein
MRMLKLQDGSMLDLDRVIYFQQGAVTTYHRADEVDEYNFLEVWLEGKEQAVRLFGVSPGKFRALFEFEKL